MITSKKNLVFFAMTFFAIHFYSCKKDHGRTTPPIVYADRVAQDSAYRIGKWYSVSNGAGYNFTSNPLLDTIWFISDSMAGWTGFGGNPYVFRPTFFKGTNSIVYITQNPLDTNKIDTIIHQCAMTSVGDTFIIYWFVTGYRVFPECYLKMNN